ncbi:unnamed protein product [Microthlaspi erraticum]|uniref:Uncharacterized protein n=1 Tax=Microthlaspi erraticum TaxID=1685480 RepID=A0A6D2HZQ6_9BRAS|nr:unnamed protein product [Microthlaspi erraticum]
MKRQQHSGDVGCLHTGRGSKSGQQEGDWNRAGSHCNDSTKLMRNDRGLAVIQTTVEKLQVKHKDHIAAYGEGNKRRLARKHESGTINTFSWGIANCGPSVRVGGVI